jgi:hypothetical protein
MGRMNKLHMALRASILVCCANVPIPAQTYRMLVAITPLAVIQWGDEEDWGMDALQNTKQLVAQINDAYNGTSPNYPTYVMPQVELAGVALVDYVESSSSYTDVARLRGTSDGYMDQIHGLRDIYAADIVMMAASLTDAGGRAAVIKAIESSAFQVTDTYAGWNAPVMAHENGHLFGCRHNIALDTTSTPYTYGHGYRPSGTWGDVMSYVDSLSQYRIWFSNPYETHLGVPRGNATTANCARVHHERKGAVAAFRDPMNTVFYNKTLKSGEYAGVVAADSILVGGVSFHLGAEGYFQAPNVILSSTYTNHGKFTVEANSIQVAGNMMDTSVTYLKASDSAIIRTYTYLNVYGKLTIEAPTIATTSTGGTSNMVILQEDSETDLVATGAVSLTGRFHVLGARLGVRGSHITTSGKVELAQSEGEFFASERVSIKPGFSVTYGSKLNVRVGSPPAGPLAKNGAGLTARETEGERADASVVQNSGFTSRLRYGSREVSLEYVLRDERSIELKVVDLRGKTVYGQRLGRQAAGSYSQAVKGTFGTGMVYFLHVQAGREHFVHRFVVQ